MSLSNHSTNKPVKIVRIQSRITIGGPALQTILLTLKLNNGDYESVLAGGGPQNRERGMIDFARHIPVDCRLLHKMVREINPVSDLVTFFHLFKLIRREKPLIVHTHTAKAGALGRLAAFFAGVPIIYHTFHGHVFHGYFGPLKSRFYIYLERMLARLSTGIIAISERQYQDLVHRYSITRAQKVSIIPLGFLWGDESYRMNKLFLKKEYGIPTRKKLVGIVGRVTHIKNIELFLSVAECLESRSPGRYHFIIIGDGEKLEFLKALTKSRKMEHIVTFTGWIEPTYSFYHDLDLVMLTSHNEGTPVSLIEALAAGVPVAARDVGGVADVLESTFPEGLVSGADPEQFVSKVESLASSTPVVPEETREKVMSRYSSGQLIENISNLYEKSLLALSHKISRNSRWLGFSEKPSVGFQEPGKSA